MKRIVVVIGVFLAISVIGFRLLNHDVAHSDTHHGHYVSFDVSMGLAQYSDILNRPDFNYVYTTFKNLYEQNSFMKLQPERNVRIPKILHIMWLGGKLPAEYRSYVMSWKNHHQTWTILFWTDSEQNYDQGSHVVHSFEELEHCLRECKGDRIVVNARNLQFDNRVYYDQANNYGERSDILKWEIVYRFGGTYVDTDFECLQPLDLYHHTYDFYTGIQPLDTHMVQLGAALYGAVPKHPILKACIENIKYNQHIEQIVVKTGPIHFTKTVLSMAGQTGLRDVVFPVSYFYPCGYEQRGTAKSLWCKAESHAVHHWAFSWAKPEAFVQS